MRRKTVVVCVRTAVLVFSWCAAMCLDQNERSTVLMDHHSEEVAECRRRGNLYAYYEPLDQCMPLLDDTSPCPDDVQVLVLNHTNLEAMCMELPCDLTHMLKPDGRCHPKEDFCSHADDKELVLKETGYGTCDCPDLHLYWQLDDTCYPAYTRGPCAQGEYIVFREESDVLCEKNPCAEDQVPWEGGCVPRVGHGCLDSVHGHLMLNPANLQFECTLRCPDSMVEVGLDCYTVYSRGPCPPGQYVVHVHGTWHGMCADNPCLEDGLLPWDGRCWHRGQYCSSDDALIAGNLLEPSKERFPQKREPDELPHESHLIILSREDLSQTSELGTVSEPLQAVQLSTGPAAGQLPGQDRKPPSELPGRQTDSKFRPTTRPFDRTTQRSTSVPRTLEPGRPVLSSPQTSQPRPLMSPDTLSTHTTSSPIENLQNPPRRPSLPEGYLPPPPSGYLPPPPNSYLPPPAFSSGRRTDHFHNAMSLLGGFSLQPFQASASGHPGRRVESPLGAASGHPGRRIALPPRVRSAQRWKRRARLSDTESARIEELKQNNGFISIDSWHPFSGDHLGTPSTHGMHISVNPMNYEVQCADSINYYRTISFAHYKCRPGSRRDLLGECHHEGPTYTDFHPDRCPVGMRHNLLTGKCKPLT